MLLLFLTVFCNSKHLQESKCYAVEHKARPLSDPRNAELNDKKSVILSDIKSLISSSQQLEQDIERTKQQIAAAGESLHTS